MLVDLFQAKAAAHGGFAQSKSDTKLTTSTPTGQSNNTRTTVKPHHGTYA